MRECPKCELCFEDSVVVCAADGVETRLSLPGGKLLAKRYLLERRLGRGAMGQVYLAVDNNLGTRKVAVKTVRQDILGSEELQEGEAILRFEREARSAASIQHPNVVSVTDFGETEDGVFYLVMEYVEGETLHRLLRREGTISIKRAVRLLRQIADGVEAAHDAGILHRDLKPANIFIMNRGKQTDDGFVKVGDFGLAKIIGHTSTTSDAGASPSSRGIIGTPEFMSPEQMQPELGVDTRADIYAMGTIAYLMLGGRTPFTGDLMQLVMQKIMHAPPPLSGIRTDIPIDVEKVIMRALATDPSKRDQSVRDWITELESAAEDVAENRSAGGSRLVVMAPPGAEVYVNDERKGSVGSSGRLVLASVPPGRHVLRVANKGDRDDERLIELREGGEEQVIQAQLKQPRGTSSQPSPSGVGSPSSSGVASIPDIVICGGCGARFADGVKFCGRCGGRSFSRLNPDLQGARMSCPKCATVHPAGSKFCGKCGHGFQIVQTPPTASGSPIPNPSQQTRDSSESPIQRFCAGCGSMYHSGIKFCGKCGKTLA